MSFTDTQRALRELRNEGWAMGGNAGDLGDKIEDLMNRLHTEEMDRIENLCTSEN